MMRFQKVSLAKLYIHRRIINPTSPAAWTKNGPEINADLHDLEVFHKAIFYPDGKTVDLKDGGRIVKILSRKTPWKEIDTESK